MIARLTLLASAGSLAAAIAAPFALAIVHAASTIGAR
jgi:hypothetical protein